MPTFKPDLTEMRRIQIAIGGGSNCRSTIYRQVRLRANASSETAAIRMTPIVICS